MKPKHLSCSPTLCCRTTQNRLFLEDPVCLSFLFQFRRLEVVPRRNYNTNSGYSQSLCSSNKIKFIKLLWGAHSWGLASSFLCLHPKRNLCHVQTQVKKVSMKVQGRSNCNSTRPVTLLFSL